MTLPITLIGGYLGAGKTTLVNHLLRHADGLRLAVLVNEFGELPIDIDLIESQNENVISIAGGCVCCSYGNDLTLELMNLAELNPSPDHVLLETSGVALPGAIAASISLLQGYALDSIAVLTDGETIQEQAADTYIGDTIHRQLNDADIVIMNKADLVPDAQCDLTIDWLKGQALGAQIITASHGVVPPEILLQSFLSRDRSGSPDHIHQSDIFETISIKAEKPVDAEALAKGLADAELNLVRAKGFVETINGEKMTIQIVARRWALSPAPTGVSTGMVAIGHKADFNPKAIRNLILQCVV